MFDESLLGYNKHVLERFELESGEILQNAEVEYTTRGTPKFDEEGNVINAVIYFHRFNGNYSSIDDLYSIVGQNGFLKDFGFFYISITSLGFPDSCSPSSTGLRYDFPHYTIKDRVNFRREFLKDRFGIAHVLGLAGRGLGGYEVYTWACEYPDEMEFIIINSSSYKTNGYRYVASKIIDSIIDSSEAYYEDIYNESISKTMVSINRLLYSNYFSKGLLQELSNDEIDILMGDFVDDGLFVDIYDLKFRNDAVLEYDVENILGNIKAKSLFISYTDDLYFSPKYDTSPVKDLVENSKICLFESHRDFSDVEDYTIFEDILVEFLEEFKQ